MARIEPVNSVYDRGNYYNLETNNRYTKNYSKPDYIDFSTRSENPPSIGTMRLTFNFLSDAQIDQINRTGKLPDNAKFMRTENGGYIIGNNFFGFREGTQELPAGYEVKKDLFGFAVVVPSGTNGAFIRK